MTKIALKFEHKPFHCPVCKQRFMNFLGQPLPNHCQVEVKTTDGNDMSIGICQDCIDKGITMEIVTAVLDGIKDYWMFEIDDDKSLTAKEKKARKAFHNSHKIDSIERVHNTGQTAKHQAKKMGKLQDGEKKGKR